MLLGHVVSTPQSYLHLLTPKPRWGRRVPAGSDQPAAPSGCTGAECCGSWYVWWGREGPSHLPLLAIVCTGKGHQSWRGTNLGSHLTGSVTLSK